MMQKLCGAFLPSD